MHNISSAGNGKKNRLYVVYDAVGAAKSKDFDVYYRYSDDGGQVWTPDGDGTQ